MGMYYTGMGLVTYSQDLTAYELTCISRLLKRDVKYSGTVIEWVWPYKSDLVIATKSLAPLIFV